MSLEDTFDFANLIKSEISAKRKEIENLKNDNSKSEAKHPKHNDNIELSHTDSGAEVVKQHLDLGEARDNVKCSLEKTSVEKSSVADISQAEKEPSSLEQKPSIDKEALPKKPQKLKKTLQSAMDTESINPRQDLEITTPIVNSFLHCLLAEMKDSQIQKNSLPGYKESKEGRLAESIFVQTNSNMKSLFKLLRRNEVAPDVMKRLVQICSLLQQREYINANNVYLRLAIGNAPWPIGVTAVGIHERSAQEKIKSNQIAHVLNDENTRKWLQSVKRLMTFCQTKYPSKDRSKMMG